MFLSLIHIYIVTSVKKRFQKGERVVVKAFRLVQRASFVSRLSTHIAPKNLLEYSRTLEIRIQLASRSKDESCSRSLTKARTSGLVSQFMLSDFLSADRVIVEAK